jgi:elongation factor Tu
MTTDPLFRMTVEDVFSIKGRGTVATGKIESGTLRVGDEVRITRQNGGIGKTAKVSGLEMFRKTAKEAAAGDNVGVLLKDVAKSDLEHGDILGADQGADLGMDFTWKP